MIVDWVNRFAGLTIAIDNIRHRQSPIVIRSHSKAVLTNARLVIDDWLVIANCQLGELIRQIDNRQSPIVTQLPITETSLQVTHSSLFDESRFVRCGSLQIVDWVNPIRPIDNRQSPNSHSIANHPIVIAGHTFKCV